MKVFRLSKSAYARQLDGLGAERSGGRWNSKGTAMVYTSESRALCLAEITVRLPLGMMPLDYMLVTLELPDESLTALPPDLLPADWRAFPHANSTQLVGDEFVGKGRFLALKVPSAVVPDEYNFLINPRHPDIRQVKVLAVEDLDFDKRLFVR